MTFVKRSTTFLMNAGSGCLLWTLLLWVWPNPKIWAKANETDVLPILKEEIRMQKVRNGNEKRTTIRSACLPCQTYRWPPQGAFFPLPLFTPANSSIPCFIGRCWQGAGVSVIAEASEEELWSSPMELFPRCSSRRNNLVLIIEFGILPGC